MKNNKQKWISRIIVILLILVSLGLYFFVPSVNKAITEIFAMLISGDTEVLAEFVEAYGPQAAVVSFLLMVLQSLAAPIPAFVITLTNANVFGWWQGAILSWSSAMAGAVLCFFLARILGRDAVEKLTNKVGIQKIDEFFERHGKLSILIARLLPFISFDYVSYAAGLTSMSFWGFFVATGIGQLPATIVYSYVGGMLTGGAQMLVTGLLILFGLSGFVILLRRLYTEKNNKKKTDKEGNKKQEGEK